MQTTLALGAFLMIATIAVDIGKAVIFYPVLELVFQTLAVAVNTRSAVGKAPLPH